MCGLVGCAGSYIGKNHWLAFDSLMHIAAVRGWDAAGVAAVFKEQDTISWKLVKQKGSSTDLIRTKDFTSIWSDHHNLRVLIGHTRWATVGKNDGNNAHPFGFEHVVGAHNGTLTVRARNQKQYDTDSEALYADINARGVEKAIPDIVGAYALTWWDNYQQTLNFLRNKERDLYIAALKYTDTIFWASEPQMLEWVLGRNGLDIEAMVRLTPDKHVKFKPFEPDWLTTCEVQEVKGGTLRVAEKAPALPFVENLEEGWWKYPKTSNVVPLESKTDSPAAKNESLRSRQRRLGLRKGYRGELLTEDEYDLRLQKGCLYCSVVPDAKEPVRWMEHDEFLCRECKDSWVGSVAVH